MGGAKGVNLASQNLGRGGEGALGLLRTRRSTCPDSTDLSVEAPPSPHHHQSLTARLSCRCCCFAIPARSLFVLVPQSLGDQPIPSSCLLDRDSPLATQTFPRPHLQLLLVTPHFCAAFFCRRSESTKARLPDKQGLTSKLQASRTAEGLRIARAVRFPSYMPLIRL